MALPGLQKTQHLYFWIQGSDPPSPFSPPVWDTAIPRHLVPKLPVWKRRPWEQGREFLRNERAPKSQFLGPVPGSVPGGDRGHPGQQQDTNPVFSRAILGVSQPLRKGLWSPGLAPECQEEMGKDHKIPQKKLLGRILPIWEKMKSSFSAGSSPRGALGRSGASQAIPSCSDSQEIQDLLSLPRATQVTPRPGLKTELGLARPEQRISGDGKDFLGALWGSRDR